MGTSREAAAGGSGTGTLGYGWARTWSRVTGSRTFASINQRYVDGITFESFDTTGANSGTFYGLSIEADGAYRILVAFQFENTSNVNAHLRTDTDWPATTAAIATHGTELERDFNRGYVMVWTGTFSAGDKIWAVPSNEARGAVMEVERIA